jgi:hypothetical protein
MAPATEPAASRVGGRASRLGPRRGVLAAGAGVLLALVLLAVLGGVLSSGGTASGTRRPSIHDAAARNDDRPSSSATTASHTRPSAKYGGLPSWLPKPKIRVNRLLSASAAHPVLSIQGVTVAVDLSGGRVLATAAGPEVPEEGHFPVPETSPCTFIVTLASASGTVPLDPVRFTFVDDFGHVHHPRVTALHGGVLPRSVPPGKTVSLKLYSVLPIGDGGLEWAPDGGRALVAWDYTVEID